MLLRERYRYRLNLSTVRIHSMVRMRACALVCTDTDLALGLLHPPDEITVGDVELELHDSEPASPPPCEIRK